MSRYFRRVGVLLLSFLLASGGGGAGAQAQTLKPWFPDGASGVRGAIDVTGGNRAPRWPGASGGAPITPTVPPEISFGGRIEESDTSAVAFAGAWSPADARLGWSGGSALQSATAGASVSFTFTGTSVRWLGSRGRNMGIAAVSLDGVLVKEVDLFHRPTDSAHMPIVTLHDLSDGRHTLTITVTGRHNTQSASPNIVVDAFEVQPTTTVSRWQDSNPGINYAGGWIQSANDGMWSGGGVSNLPELPMTAHEASAAGATLTLPFRGTGIAVLGYRGPDAGIAQIQVDGGGVTEVDLYSPVKIWQPIVYTASGLSDVNHTLTITVTGRKNGASSNTRVVIDAFDVYTPGRRYEEYESSRFTYAGVWTPDNLSRPWSEGKAATSNKAGSTVTFTFTGTSVSWIGCQKGSASGRARVSIDGVFMKEVNNNQNYPIEGYQMTVFRADGLAPGPHTLTLEVISNSGYVVVDAFDVR
jgi:hypothetical protein